MPSNWSKIRDEWLDRTAVAKDDAKWALEALINSEEELFEIEQKIKNKEDAISQVKFLKKKVKETISSKEISLDDIALNTSNSKQSTDLSTIKPYLSFESLGRSRRKRSIKCCFSMFRNWYKGNEKQRFNTFSSSK